MNPDLAPPARVREQIGQVLHGDAVDFLPVAGGYTPAERYRVEMADGRIVFAKRAVDAFTLTALRAERAVYERVSGPFMPDYLGFVEDVARPVLLTGFIDGAGQAPPWSDERIEAVFECLAQMHALCVHVTPFERHWMEVGPGWATVESDPAPFLSMGFASRDWLDRHLPVLVANERQQSLAGLDLGHFDLRSDNILFTPERAVLVDWSSASLGPASLDIALWLPSLHLEGGPPPERLLPGAPCESAWVSGFFAARAGLEPIPHAPRVRSIQRDQLRAALPWAVRELGLREPDGPAARELLAADA